MTNTADHRPHPGHVALAQHRRPAARPVRPAVARLSREFRELPGLQLTIDQAARLAGVDHASAEDALRALAAAGILLEGADGAFRRAEPALRLS
jgi:hypothetical protein